MELYAGERGHRVVGAGGRVPDLPRLGVVLREAVALAVELAGDPEHGHALVTGGGQIRTGRGHLQVRRGDRRAVLVGRRGDRVEGALVLQGRRYFRGEVRLG